MKVPQIILVFILGIALGTWAGFVLARERARVAVISGPDSDNYGQARSAIAEAVTKLRAGNTNVIENLSAADAQIEKAQLWTKRFLGRERDRAQ